LTSCCSRLFVLKIKMFADEEPGDFARCRREVEHAMCDFGCNVPTWFVAEFFAAVERGVAGVAARPTVRLRKRRKIKY